MDFKRGLRDGIPICLGYFSVSIAFGVLTIQKGLTWLEALMISFFNLTSAGQYAGLTIIAATGGLVEIALSQLVINARYALMGISLSQKLDKNCNTPSRLVLGFAITDEIFAVAAGNKSISRSYFAGLAVLPILGWSGGTLCGALLGGTLPAIIQSALGVALYGMFIASVVPAAKADRKVLIVVGISVLCSCLLYYVPIFDFISDGFAVIICTVIAAALGAVLFPREEAQSDAV
ncbi:MAG: AzlC family ABC transporter permease [Clostridia bacterium]|nr:AzlC family ABC transporter permease [Clostridia bacterium]